MSNNFLFKIFIVTLVIAICSGNNNPDEEKNNTKSEIFDFVPKTDEAFLITVEKAETFSIKIKGNPSTGYGWYLENISLINESLIKPLNLDNYNGTDDYVADKNPQGMVGGGGNYFFKFVSVNKGQLTLTFSNKRPWDPSTAKTYLVNVVIN